MATSDLLSTVRGLILDETAPYLHTDAKILSFLNEAERMLCVQTHVLVDPEVVLDLEVGVGTYTLPRNILRVYAARSTNSILTRIKGKAYAAHLTDTSGTPTCYSTNTGDKMLTVFPAPDAVDVIEIMCAVTPESLIEKGKEASVPTEHQYILTYYAAYRCLVIPDEDGQSLAVAGEYKDQWGEAVRDLKREIYRFRTADRMLIENWTGNQNT